MDTISILTPTDFPETLIVERLRAHWEITGNGESSSPYCVQVPWDTRSTRVYIYKEAKADIHREGYYSQRFRDQFDSWGDAQIFSVDYSWVLLANKVLMSIADDDRMFVDLNLDIVMWGHELVRKLRSNPSWDWRAEWRREHPSANADGPRALDFPAKGLTGAEKRQARKRG